MKKPEDQLLVIFGASGDLTSRKLVPALYSLFKRNVTPEKFVVLGVSRSELSDDQFRRKLGEGIQDSLGKGINEEQMINSFLERFYYLPLDMANPPEYYRLVERIDVLTTGLSPVKNILFYLSTPPVLFGPIARNIGSCGLQKETEGFRRIIVEKPFGYDLESSRQLRKELHASFEEKQIYRIDHYLGKETVQNLLVMRFGNGIFEPLWNRNYIDHVEITSAESLGVEGRGGYYDGSGALRDMVQNHLLQMVGLTAMEPPSSMEADSLRNEVFKVFQSLRPIREEDVSKQVIRGQYVASHIRGELVPGYREESGVQPESRTETFAAIKFYIDNWRWGGVPFYIRTGKRLPTRVTEVVIHFKPTPHNLFRKEETCMTGNQLIIRIQPDEGILLKFGLKEPGSGFQVKTVNMDFHYSDLRDVHVPPAYERLIHDAMTGDSTLYSRADAVEESWKFVAPILKAWEREPGQKIYGYPAGTWGPQQAESLIENSSGWRYPCKNLADDGEYCEL
ncbi:MAG TPA: glucose-6-phosphate dehydrogenase [Prolixibacteraceae bacterium]|nr:glucose-6-phosphate dehydrogenase [Prolixibacteraceae bacterium]